MKATTYLMAMRIAAWDCGELAIRIIDTIATREPSDEYRAKFETRARQLDKFQDAVSRMADAEYAVNAEASA